MGTEKVYRIMAESLNLREEPSLHGAVLKCLSKGTEVKLISISGDDYWYKVETADGVTGWASQKYLQLVTETSGDHEFPWMAIARAEIGTREFSGSGDNPRVVEYLRSTNLPAPDKNNDETPWCSGFVNWCMEKAGIEGTDSAWARSWKTWGKGIEKPTEGCVVVLKRGTTNGHVGFYVGETANKIKLLAGNQRDEVNISSFPKGDLLGYRLPGTFA